MAETTVNLQMPYILPSQAQKHVTHNEALQRLDAVVQMVVINRLPAPPASPQQGECYVISAKAAGEWAGREGRLAFRQDGAWQYLLPLHGWRAWFVQTNDMRVYDGSEWTPLPMPQSARFNQLGVFADPDNYNRFAMSSPASLFNHEGNGHQLKINKAALTDTASLLFQSGFKGHAEMGLAGSSDFSIKVSPDGQAWTTAFSISGDGAVMTPHRPLARASQQSGTLAVTAQSRWGFSTLDLARGGFALGPPVPGGLGRQLLVPQSGVYGIVMNASLLSSSGHTVMLAVNDVQVASVLQGPATATASFQTATLLWPLQRHDRLTLHFRGAAQMETGPEKTGLSLFLIS